LEPIDTEHKVTVMVHRSDLQQLRKPNEVLPQQQQQQPQLQQQQQQQLQQQQQPGVSVIKLYFIVTKKSKSACPFQYFSSQSNNCG
jgi:hypothetical protein